VVVKVEVVEVNGGTVSPGGAGEGSWIYAWVTRPEGQVLYVGSTSLAPSERAHLHLHHPSPAVARIATLRPSALSEDFVVVAVPVDEGIERTAAKLSAISLLGAGALLGPNYVGPLPTATAARPESSDAATALVCAVRHVINKP